jgi:hypothetical protein
MDENPTLPPALVVSSQNFVVCVYLIGTNYA